MDTSEKYIRMCESAQEIQDIKRKFNSQVRYGLDVGDYYWIKRLNIVGILEENGIGSVDSIWLPRQDQLQEMIEFENLERMSFQDFHERHIRFNRFVNSLYQRHESGAINIHIYNFESLEQLWLSFVMKEKYNKTWNEDKQEWNTKS